jgi:dihydropteroate synthase
LKIGNKQFDIGSRTHIVGVLNVTPDSFSDGDSFNTIDAAIAHALKMETDGADIIEIGAESTRPNHQAISVDEELSRIIPILQAIKNTTGIPICVDTRKSQVAKESIENGADLINDVMCFKADENLAKVCAKFQVPVITMHNRPNEVKFFYDNFLEELSNDLLESVDILTIAGVNKNNIILDPGIGFAKQNHEQNLDILRNIQKLRELGFPIMIGASKKSFMQYATGLAVNERKETTMAVTAYSATYLADFVRVHDVLENKRVAMMIDSLVRKRKD